MCTKCIQRIDSSILNFHTSSILKQNGQQHFQSYIASPAGCKCIHNHNDKGNIKSRNTIPQESDVDSTVESVRIQNIACLTTVKNPIGTEQKYQNPFCLYI